MSDGKFRRKTYIIKKGFQSRIITIILLLVIIVTNITGGIVYGILRIDSCRDWLTKVFYLSNADDLLLPAVIISELASFIIVGIISLFVSHRMAGPIYRFEKVAEGVSGGDLTINVKLRDKDEFKDLADAFNDMIQSLTDRIDMMKESSFKYIEDSEKYISEKKDIPEKVRKDIETKLIKFKKDIEFFKTDKDENSNKKS